MRKINLLIITDTYIGIPGGSERHLLNFLTLLDHDHFNVTALQFFPMALDVKNVGMHSEINQVNFIHRPLANIKSFKFIKLFFFIIKLIKSHNIDMVISYHEKSDLLNYLLKFIPSVKTTRISSKRDLGFKLDGILKKLMLFVIPSFKTITTPSHSIKQMLTSEYKVPNANVHVIANGVDLNLYKKGTAPEKEKFRENLNIDKHSYVGICVGSLREVKGHDFLIRSFADFQKSSQHQWHLIIIGAGPLKNDLIELTKEFNLTNVHFVGLQTNVDYWLSHSDVIVSSSSSEGLSNALLEGIASGLPAIGTNVGGTPELVRPEKNGILVEYGNQLELSNAFSFFDKTPKKLVDYGNSSRGFAEKEYSNEIMVDRMESLYRDIFLRHEAS